MTNCHDLFLEFNSNLNITATKKSNLMDSRDALRDRIKKHFKENHPDYKPEFFIQGSYKMKTLVRTKGDTCDLDDGIHFKIEPDVTPTTLQKWVYEAVEGHTDGGQEHRNKCIRVIYKNDYHIDLPIYKQSEDDDYPFLAVKNKDWDEEESDPKGFVDWYNDNKTDQITRNARYKKAWGDKKNHKMPNGLAMSLFAEKYTQSNERDDIGLKDTLIKMRKKLKANWEALMPTRPFDDVLSNYDETFKNNFFTALDDFIDDAEKALEEESELKASKLWRKHLGSRFPLGEDEGTNNKAAILGIANSGTHKPYFLHK